ncbi:MAG TPA: hypothetical protein PKE51_10930 [Gemmatimonadaceae bacterium]|nr:hypothetical protein [Gemmatimonadaceae bacterium]
MSDETSRSTLKLLAHFAASCSSAFGGILAFLVVKSPRALTMGSAKTVMLEIAMIVAGYAVTKVWLPRRGSTISGTPRSHVLAGLAAPFALGALSTQIQGVSSVGIAILSGATGITLALAHWLVTLRPPREPQPTLEEREKAADLALARALAELEGSRDVIPLPRRERDRQSSARVA